MLADTVYLSSRLRNCLVTILEIEKILSNSELGSFLQKEFETLKEIMNDFGQITIDERNVSHIEKVTDKFLRELQQIPDYSYLSLETDRRIIQ